MLSTPVHKTGAKAFKNSTKVEEYKNISVEREKCWKRVVSEFKVLIAKIGVDTAENGPSFNSIQLSEFK